MKKIFFLLFLIPFLGTDCAYTIKIKDGKTAYERKQYAVAAKFLKKEYDAAKSRSDKSKIAYMLADSYRHSNKEDDATTWFKKAYDDATTNVDALKEYAFGLKKAENYKEAAEAFKALGQEIGSPYEYRKEITACTVAAQWVGDVQYSGYTVEPASFNTANAEYAPAIYKDGAVVVTSDRSTATGDALYGWTGNRYSDLFIVDNKTLKPFDEKTINTNFNDATASFTADYNEMFFTRCGENAAKDAHFCRLMTSRKVGDKWGDADALPFVKDKINYGHPSVSKDGHWLYFSSNDPEGWGGYDIYACERGPNGFENPKLLPRTVNTVGNEEFPFIDGDTLYFASDYLPGMGGLDVFKTYKMKDGTWSPAQNLKSPLNSGGDDFGFVIDDVSDKQPGVIRQGYFSSNRKGGKGNDDVYRFEYRTPKPRPLPLPDTTKKKIIAYKMILDGVVLEKIHGVVDNPNSPVIGRKPLPDSKVTITFNSQKREVTVNKDGGFSLELDSLTDYRFSASHTDYLNNQTTFTTKGIGKDPANPVQRFEIEIVLDKVYRGKEIVLENIYYDFDKWNIRKDAEPTLDRLAATLQQNPAIKIQLSSHTDCRGGAAYNETLSQKRASSAVAYLISKGLPADRLVAKGYGLSLPAVSCDCKKCTEDEHQANRRTTFKVLE